MLAVPLRLAADLVLLAAFVMFALWYGAAWRRMLRLRAAPRRGPLALVLRDADPTTPVS